MSMAEREAMRQGFEEAVEAMGIPTLVAIVRDLAEMSGAPDDEPLWENGSCALCWGGMNIEAGAVVHDAACPWRRAREWVAAHGGQP